MPSKSDRQSTGPAHPTGMNFAIAGAALLVVAGVVAFSFATGVNQKQTAGVVGAPIRVTSTACEPNAMTVAAGRRSFEITNASDRPIEWEILDGVVVVAERENIAPGFRQMLTVTLAPGDYDMTCGLLSNPRGTLRVTPSEEWSTASADIGLRAFLGALGEYKVFLITEANAAIAGAEALSAAIKDNDLDNAQNLWRAARLPYKHIEPLAYRLSDLESAIDPVADYLAGRETDPGFTGYHRLEYGLFETGTTDGLTDIADALISDLTELKTRVSAFSIDPALLVALPADMARQLADGRIEAGEDHYAHADLAELAASLDGIAKLAGLLQDVLAPVDPALVTRIGDRLAATTAEIAALKSGDTYPTYDTVNADSRARLAGSFAELADTLDQINRVIGGV